jgi:divalent metal cation (Fe/Co/Zn/Cd) transporter
MPVLALYKKKIAAEINSRALRADALETLACSYLSLTLLLGLGANALFGWWWADPVAALAMIYLLVREGVEAIQEGREDPLSES